MKCDKCKEEVKYPFKVAQFVFCSKQCAEEFDWKNWRSLGQGDDFIYIKASG